MLVLVIGSPTKEFGVGKGLRQGDPLAFFLFLIATERFNLWMSKGLCLTHFEGYDVGSRNVSVSHLQHADDILIVGKNCWKNVRSIKEVLYLFEMSFGLKVNSTKVS